MKKIMNLFVLLAMLLSLGMSGFAVAAADESLAPPARPHMPAGTYDFSIPVSEVGAASSEIETVTPAVLGETAVWRSTAAGSAFRFRLFIVGSVTGNTSNLEAIYCPQKSSSDNTFSYTIREPGKYYLYCDVTNESGTTQTSISFEVEDRSGAVTVSSRVKEIVAECRTQVSAADAYGTALWLHDWITTHSYYDLTYCYHGPDSILFYGTGVCDSYSKLYLQLMREAGYEVERVTGGNHAWNCALIDGVWCQIDPTWDDPSGDYTAVSGDENHDYFGVNDEIMSLDHEYTVTRPCTSLLNCAIRREGTVEVWLSHIWSSIESSFRDGIEQNSFDTQGKLMAGDGAYYPKSDYVDEKYTVAAIILSQREWTFQGNQSVTAKFSYDAGANTLSYVCGESGQTDPTGTLTPGNTANVTIAAGETQYLSFVPTESDTYIFSSTGDCDTYGTICDQNRNVLAADDDGGEGSNFSVSAELTAGTQYYLGVRFYDTQLSATVTVRLEHFAAFPYTVLSDGTASITGCNVVGDIEIPSSVDGYTVSNLASQLFYGKSGITSVTVPATVTYFGSEKADNNWDYVFSYCFDLENIYVDPENPTFRSVDGVLYSKDGQTLINYPCSHPGTVYHTGAATLCCTSFAYNQNLKFLFLENPNVTWYTYTFNNTGAQTTFYQEGGSAEQKVQTEIENGREYSSNQSWCRLLSTANIQTLPADLTEIETEAFNGAGIQYLIVPDGCRRIESGAFTDGALEYVSLPRATAADGAFGPSTVVEYR